MQSKMANLLIRVIWIVKKKLLSLNWRQMEAFAFDTCFDSYAIREQNKRTITFCISHLSSSNISWIFLIFDPFSLYPNDRSLFQKSKFS